MATPSPYAGLMRAADSNDARERVLLAAARLFHERGYSSTTVRDIAREVGILSGSLFHHFPSKGDMLLEIMRDAAHAVCERAEAILARNLPDQDALRELIRLEFDSITHVTRRHFHGVLFFEWREVPQDARAEFGRLRKRYQRSWMSVLERCYAEGKLRCEPQAASLILHGALRNALTWYSSAGRYSAEEFGEILSRLVLDP
jgi:TetR/AcrR family transcriptional regulator, cholesterol catabolism regulator